MINYSELALVAMRAASIAGDTLKRRFGDVRDIQSKVGMHNFVTDVDLTVERLVVDAIHSHFPTHGILAEESGRTGEHEVLWIIDPLDGTLNFIHSVPFYAVSIAAAVLSEIVVGVVYLPQLDEFFMAQKGFGAYLNGKKISVSSVDALENAMLVTGSPYHLPEKIDKSIQQYASMLELRCPIRDLGSAVIDLAYVASGRFDGYWMPTVQPWDLAAGKLLIEEAGGAFTTYTGELYTEFRESGIVASNGRLHKALIHRLHTTQAERKDG